MLGHLYPAERIRDRAIGVWTAVCGLALALGPIIGGVLVAVWDWRAIFWFNLAFGAGAYRVDIPGFAFGAFRPKSASAPCATKVLYRVTVASSTSG